MSDNDTKNPASNSSSQGKQNDGNEAKLTDVDYLKEQKARIATFKVGNSTKWGYKITDIYKYGDEFVIYGIESKNINNSFRIYIDTITEKDSTGILKRLNKLELSIEKAKAVLYKALDADSYKSILAGIISSGLAQPENPQEEHQSISESIEALEHEIKGIEAEYEKANVAKIGYITTCFYCLCFTSLVAILVYLFKGYFVEYQIIKNIAYVIGFGALGGFFSVALKFKNLDIERGKKPSFYIRYAILRMLISILGGLFVFIIIKSKFLFNITIDEKKPETIYALFTMAIVAGFSETIVPDALHSFETKK